MNFFHWDDEDSQTKIYKKELLGVKSLNKLDELEFKKKICDYIKYLNPIKINGCELYFKHDINNGILTRLQMNDNLDESKYIIVNKIRDFLWLKNDFNTISFDELIEILNI